ncbi:MAG: ankyrin repeat domain-containing protein [Verrucomicrobia bacterium]|nr:ankyrin repeat domain-containing protein [Verrucomicrobiota bacterium]
MTTSLHRLLFLTAVGLGALASAPAQPAARDADGNTPLHLAALNHDVAAVRTLLAAGSEVDAKNTAEATPLLYGAGHPEIVRLLLARGANPNAAAKSKNTPLIAAVSHAESFEAAKLLLEAGADVHAVKRPDTELILDRATQAGDRRTFDLLVAQGAAKNPQAASAALSTAAWRGNLDAVRLLLERGGDPNYDDRFTGHALNIALYGGHPEVAQFLIGHGADLKRRSPRGHGTPPMVWAAYNDPGDPAVARALLAKGIDVNEANDAGATALALAERNGPDTPLVRFLREAGAKSPEAVRVRQIPDRPVPATPAARAALVRERLQPTLDLLARGSDTFLENAFVQRSKCTSCHQQDLPGVAFELARVRGFRVNDAVEGRQHEVLTARWNAAAESARQMTDPVPDPVVSLGYGFFGLHAARYAPDDTTDALVRYLLRVQQPAGNWAAFDRRPPMEDGVIVGTAWATLPLRDYPPAALRRETAAAQARAARWLAAQVPATHNDTVFQLLGLHWAGAPMGDRAKSVERLLALQRPDGGWAQLPGLASDAWATGVSLYALHEAAGMKPDDAIYQRGVAYLLRTQFEDGSWWVKSRAWPFQPHFDGKFPHGKDQWISSGGTAWAAMALLFTLDPVPPAAPAPTAREMMAAYANSPAAKRAKNAAAPAPAASAPAANPTQTTTAAVDFTRDIQPIFERSCVGCHNPEKSRGRFALVSREALLKGGASGEPAIAPGHADASTLIHYVTDKIEDLEMPPLDRREKYPALTAAEIALLRTWIDSGAPWPAAKPAAPATKSISLED